MKAAVNVLGNMLEPGKNKVIDMIAQSTNGQEGNSCPKFLGAMVGWEAGAKVGRRSLPDFNFYPCPILFLKFNIRI